MAEEVAGGVPIEDAPRLDSGDGPPTVVRSKDYVTVYSNFVQCGRSAWDIALAFGRLAEYEPGKGGIVELVNVTVTPGLAKALVQVLNTTVKQYEAENGEIKLPAMITRNAEALIAQLKKAEEEAAKATVEGSPVEAAKE